MNTNIIRAVLVDDEESALNALSKLLKDFVTTPIKVFGKAKTLEEGVRVIKENKPDVVFLDIDLPDKNGMEIYKYFEKPYFKIIFVTAYNQYAIDALKN